MTYQDREEIFAKEALHIKDIMKLYGMKYATAAKLIQDMKIKRSVSGKPLRTNIAGYIHVVDYLEEISLDPNNPGDRYQKEVEKSASARLLHEHARSKRKTLCV